uniref:Uncharacterized protein n=1 Tax=Anguilla anguilla TaxID=7936 RepID=A0A0E9XJ38_ANGAN
MLNAIAPNLSCLNIQCSWTLDESMFISPIKASV